MRAIACLTLLLGLWTTPGWADLYDIDGLRLGMTRLEVQQRLPGIEIRDVAYENERIGFNYKITYGRLAILRYEGEILRVGEAGRADEIRLSFTGRDELYDIRVTRLDARQRCAGHLAAVETRWGRPLIDERPAYAMWRTTVVLGPRLSFQCLDDARGLYELRLDQESLQSAYINDLSEDLGPALREAIQFLLGR